MLAAMDPKKLKAFQAQTVKDSKKPAAQQETLELYEPRVLEKLRNSPVLVDLLDRFDKQLQAVNELY